MLDLIGRQVRVEQQLGHSDDAVHRRANFMAERGDEPRFQARGFLCTFQSGAERFPLDVPFAIQHDDFAQQDEEHDAGRNGRLEFSDVPAARVAHRRARVEQQVESVGEQRKAHPQCEERPAPRSREKSPGRRQGDRRAH